MSGRDVVLPGSASSVAFRVNARELRGFILRFAGIAVLLSTLPILPGWDAFVDRWMAALAVAVNMLLHLLGQHTRVAGDRVFSGAYNVTLAAHCSALDILLFFSATVLAFPASRTRRFVGLAGGIVFIAALNVVRIASIYLVGARWPAHVHGIHERLWPVLLILGTLVLSAAWLCWATSQSNDGVHP